MDKTITKQRAILTLFLLMVLLFCVSCTKKERILDETAHDGLTVQIVGKDEVYGEALLLQKETEENRIMMPEMEPWQVDFCNIDEGEVELALGVHKESPYHPVKTRRIFFYTIEDLRLVPKYRMSRLTYPFTDFRMMDIDEDGRDEILALEQMRDGSFVIGGYRWTNFGFERVYASEEMVPEDFFAREQGKNLHLNGERIEWEEKK